MALVPPPGWDVEIIEIDGEVLAVLRWQLGEPREVGTVKLSRAEKEVLAGICEGRSDSAIAAARATSIRTVHNQVAALRRKFGVTSRYELVAKLRGV